MNAAVLPPALREHLAKKKRLERELAAAVRGGLRDADLERLSTAIELADERVAFGHRLFMRTAKRCPPPPMWFRRRFRDAIWLPFGDHLRCEVGDDLLLADALRVLLPPYRGRAVRLWRGEGAWNRRRRTYGLSWSRHAEVADAFARGMWRTFEGGSVLLETEAPVTAIICAIPDRQDGYGEKEVLVDRRRLGEVRVVTRYDQQPLEGRP